jgi:hypothetical protein
MGWGSASGIFNDMADALIEAGASDEVITATLAKTIGNLRGDDWDTYDESLDAFSEHPAVVEAFRQNGIFLEYCEAEQPGRPMWESCQNEKGHDGDHRYREKTWPNEKK